MFGGDVFTQEIQASFVHTDDADGGKVVLPVQTGSVFNITQVKAGIRVQVFFGEQFQNLALDCKAFSSQKNLGFQNRKKVFLCRTDITNTRQIDRYDTDGSRQRVGPKKAAASL